MYNIRKHDRGDVNVARASEQAQCSTLAYLDRLNVCIKPNLYDFDPNFEEKITKLIEKEKYYKILIDSVELDVVGVADVADKEP